MYHAFKPIFKVLLVGLSLCQEHIHILNYSPMFARLFHWVTSYGYDFCNLLDILNTSGWGFKYERNIICKIIVDGRV